MTNKAKYSLYKINLMLHFINKMYDKLKKLPNTFHYIY